MYQELVHREPLAWSPESSRPRLEFCALLPFSMMLLVILWLMELTTPSDSPLMFWRYVLAFRPFFLLIFHPYMRIVRSVLTQSLELVQYTRDVVRTQDWVKLHPIYSQVWAYKPLAPIRPFPPFGLPVTPSSPPDLFSSAPCPSPFIYLRLYILPVHASPCLRACAHLLSYPPFDLNVNKKAFKR